jgi:plasmid stabilization system protein ParE
MDRTEKETPQAYTLRITESALEDINNITGYIAYIRHEPLNAIRTGDKIFETFDRIEKSPFVFRECDEIPTKTKIYRKANCLIWLIIYKIKVSEIVILGIIHGHRKPSRIRVLRKIK